MMRQMSEKFSGMEERVNLKLDSVERRVDSIEKGGADAGEVERCEESDDEEGEELLQLEESGPEANITPNTLRKDIKIMSQAAERLAQLSVADDLEMETTGLTRIREQGRKSGAYMLPSDVVKRRVDWPHMHVQRMVAGKRKSVPFVELRVEEFVSGFLRMLKSPRSKMDPELMMPLLDMVMEDTIDYSWANALNFYLMVGLDVEYGVLAWDDSERIKEMRFKYSRAVFPEKKEAKEGNKQNNKGSSQGIKCCAVYQKQACEHTRDHHPFTHACAYCFKATAMVCRHPENECQRKTNDEAKNAKRGE